MELTNDNAADQRENLGGTTNLTLEQLKEEGGTANFSEDAEAADDLNEIRGGGMTWMSLIRRTMILDALEEPLDDEALDDESADNPENNT
jgi:hypothetical protein